MSDTKSNPDTKPLKPHITMHSGPDGVPVLTIDGHPVMNLRSIALDMREGDCAMVTLGIAMSRESTFDVHGDVLMALHVDRALTVDTYQTEVDGQTVTRFIARENTPTEKHASFTDPTNIQDVPKGKM